MTARRTRSPLTEPPTQRQQAEAAPLTPAAPEDRPADAPAQQLPVGPLAFLCTAFFSVGVLLLSWAPTALAMALTSLPGCK